MVERTRAAGSSPRSSATVSSSGLVIIIITAIILSKYDGDCDTPIRLWLQVYMWFMVVNVAINLILKIVTIFKPDGKIVSQLLLVLNFFSLLFVFVWFIVGNVWYFGAGGECDDFEEGYILTLVYIILMYIGFCCCGVSCCCMISLGDFFVGKKMKEAAAAQEMERRRQEEEHVQ